MIDDFKERHYWSTSQTSHIDCKSGMNKSFFLPPFISPTVTERLYNQCISATYMGSWGAKLPQSETGHMEQWLLNPGASRAPSGHKTWKLNLTPRSFVKCRNSSIYSLIHGTLHKKAYLCHRPQHGEVLERLLHRQSANCAAVRLSLQSAVIEWWMLRRTDTLFSPPLLPVDMPHGSCLLFHELCYSSRAARSPY